MTLPEPTPTAPDGRTPTRSVGAAELALAWAARLLLLASGAHVAMGLARKIDSGSMTGTYRLFGISVDGPADHVPQWVGIPGLEYPNVPGAALMVAEILLCIGAGVLVARRSPLARALGHGWLAAWASLWFFGIIWLSWLECGRLFERFGIIDAFMLQWFFAGLGVAVGIAGMAAALFGGRIARALARVGADGR